VLPLDSARWNELQHAYGSASDVPLLLRSIASDPASSSSTEGPWFDLWSALCHQGDVYSASFAAVPHIVNTLANATDRACADFFSLPASIEVARIRRNVPVPADLRLAYESALGRLPSCVAAVAARPWDDTICQSVLAAIAASKSRHSIAELLLVVDEPDILDVLKWYIFR
jgi:hypothetical protein